MQKLTVYPNPFTALGADGMPCGRVLVEPTHPRPLDIVGGKLTKKRLDRVDEHHSKKEIEAARKLDTRGSLIRGVAIVRMRPIVLNGVEYFQKRVGSGELIAADKATYIALFGPRSAKDFQEPLDFLKGQMRLRIREWMAVNGAPPAVAGYALVKNGDEIALAAKDTAEKRPVAPAVP